MNKQLSLKKISLCDNIKLLENKCIKFTNQYSINKSNKLNKRKKNNWINQNERLYNWVKEKGKKKNKKMNYS